MATLDINYYNSVFNGNPIDQNAFVRLKMIAEDLVYDVCNKKPTEEQMLEEAYLKAICYEIEMLNEQGGVDAILGFSENANGIASESLGGYSVSNGNVSGGSILVKDGIPVSSLAISQLRRLGLISRWMYSGVRRNGEP